MIEITVEGIYESDTGSGQKKYQSFKYTFKISRLSEKGIETHVQKRFVPLLIEKDKKNSGLIFSRLKSCLITSVKKVNDGNSIIGKDIRDFSILEIQDLASTFDLYKVPLPNVCSLSEMRDLAILAYMEKVLKIPMKTTRDKDDLAFLEKQSDGTFKLKLEDRKVLAEMPSGYFEIMEKVKKPAAKKDLSYFIQKAGQTIANGILSVTGNNSNSTKTEENNYPTENELLQQ